MALMKTGSRPTAQIGVGFIPNGEREEEDPGLTGAAKRAAERTRASSGQAGARRHRTYARQQKAAERIAMATAELSSGVAEAAAACEELRKAMEQISAGAEEAASAAEQSQQAVTAINGNILRARDAADVSLKKTEGLQQQIGALGGQIQASIGAISQAAERQEASVGMVAELDQQAANIGEIVKAVAHIADQTNLLALNAAIEAARAGQHGKGFAVVADEVRTLAETSERSARDIQDLVKQIQSEVTVVAQGIKDSAASAKTGAEMGHRVSEQLASIDADIKVIQLGSQEILAAAIEAEGGAREAQQGAESIGAAAAEQAAACEEAVKTVLQQTTALEQSEQAATELADLSEELKNATNIVKSAEEVASSSEEMSSAMEEINRSSTQIMAAIEQISRGAQQQSAAAQQSSAAIVQIERAAEIANGRAQVALEKGMVMTESLSANRDLVEDMIINVARSVEANGALLSQVNQLEQVSRRIDKIVDAITTVSIQTNMLAVNGSVEAARAGEYGKGFAVVSTDIRNLARDSAENAERIKDLVKSVQDQIVVVRRDLEDTAALAASEVQKNRAITAGLTAVTEEMDAVSSGNREIVSGAEHILSALGEARQGTEQIATAAGQAQQAAQQAATATRQQAKGSEELAGAIEEIASIADELQTMDVA